MLLKINNLLRLDQLVSRKNLPYTQLCVNYAYVFVLII